MPIYTYRCYECETKQDSFRLLADLNVPEICDCGVNMTRLVFDPDSLPSIRSDYERPIMSTSLAFDAAEIDEHRKRFPGIEVRTDGCSAYPVLRSLTQKRDYLRDRQFEDVNSFT